MSDQTLPTEQRNLHTLDIDTWSTAEVVRATIHEDRAAIDAAAIAAQALADAADLAIAAIAAGGSVHYFGAGASGRLAFLDATEIGPTFSAPPNLFVSHFPGGDAALLDSHIDLEDEQELGMNDGNALTKRDFAVGISASGTTSYVRGALTAARATGAGTALITSSPNSALGEFADVVIAPATGAEAVTGSTRLKAGTAAKVLLNAFSTAVMIGQGATYSNLMVMMNASNSKLGQRALRVLTMATTANDEECTDALREADGDLSVALVRLLSSKPVEEARHALASHGSVRAAVQHLR